MDKDKVYVVSYTIALARRWAEEQNIEPQRLVVMLDWEDMMGLDGFNKVLHILPSAFRIKRYSIMMEYANQYHWAKKYERV